LFFREIICLNGIQNTIVCDHDAEFLRHFWRSLWNKLRTKLLISTTYHPQTHSTHSSTKMSPFQIVYGYIPRVPIDLFLLDAEDAQHVDVVAHVEQMINLHEQTQQNVATANAKYQVAGSEGRRLVTFELGTIVWLQLRKDGFPTLYHSKLMPHAVGPF
jgi:hypothetical protein